MCRFERKDGCVRLGNGGKELFLVSFHGAVTVYTSTHGRYNKVIISTDGANRVVTDCKDVKNEALGGIYRELATLVGIDNTLKIHANYRGQQVTFPVELYSKAYIAAQIAREYDGKNIKQLATKFGYSEKWIRKILKEYADGRTND